jgi:hypothetical protein
LRKDKLKNLTDKSMKPVIVGTLDGSRSWAQGLAWAAGYLGWNLRFVVGYPGSASLTLAARRGEIDSFGTSGIEIHRSLLRTGKFQGIAQLGEAEGNKVVRRKSFPDVPTLPELMKGKTSGIAKQAFDFWSRMNQIDKWYALPPKTPNKIVKIYRVAYAKAVKDPEFIKFGRHQFSIDFRAVRAETIAGLVASTAYPNLEMMEFIRQLRIKNGLPAARLSDAELAKLAKKLGGPVLKVKQVKLDAVKRGGRFLYFKNKGAAHKAKVSGSRTKVKIDGKKAKRKKLKKGMTCDITYTSNNGEVKTVSCSPSQS